MKPIYVANSIGKNEYLSCQNTASLMAPIAIIAIATQ